MIIWNIIFYLSSAIMIVTAAALLFVRQPMHGAVYLITSLLALAVDFYMLGSPFIAVLQVILYIGAIMVLYVFFIMMNPLDKHDDVRYSGLAVPLILLITLVVESAYLLLTGDISGNTVSIITIEPEALGLELFGHYKVAVEVISTLLLATLVAVIYLARPLGHRGKDK